MLCASLDTEALRLALKSEIGQLGLFDLIQHTDLGYVVIDIARSCGRTEDHVQRRRSWAVH